MVDERDREPRLPELSRRLIGFLLLILAVVPSSGIVSAAASPPVPLSGHVLRSLPRMTHLGPAPRRQALTLTIVLRPSLPIRPPVGNQTPAAGAGRATPQMIGQVYGRPLPVIDALAAYLTRFGLSIRGPRPDRLSFQVTGTVEQVERALQVEIDQYLDQRGRQFYATTVDPQLPANLAGSVQAILGLDNYPALHATHAQRGSPGSYTPADLRAAYNLNPLYEMGLNGAGETIGVVGCDSFNLLDLRTFESLYGLPAVPVTEVDVDGGPTGSDIETTLDLEWSNAIAPGASLRFYGFDCSLQGFIDTMATATNEDAAAVISISLGACEVTLPPAFIAAAENALAVAASQGQSVMVASGDAGAFECGGSTPSVSYPGSSAAVTSVGGTSLFLSSGSYGSESAWGAWSGCNGAPCGSGGGLSGVIARPSWQSAVNPSGLRGLPDVALNADPRTGNVVFFQGVLQSGWGGTSIATPQWAGITAIASQAAGHRLGNLGPSLYGCALAGARSTPASPYHDITTGGNLYYNATPGWDLATGWGSPNAANFVSFFRTVASPPGPYRVYLPVVFSTGCLG